MQILNSYTNVIILKIQDSQSLRQFARANAFLVRNEFSHGANN